jgi:Flp pilus assembly protein TadG
LAVQRFVEIIDRFRDDRRGNLAVVFAFACLPLMAAIGCAVDYARLNQLRGKLQAAADAASVGSIATTSPSFTAAFFMKQDGRVAAAERDAANIFNGNMAAETGYTLDNVKATVTRNGRTVTSTVAFSAMVPTTFLGMVGRRAMPVSCTSSAVATLPSTISLVCSGKAGCRVLPEKSQSHVAATRLTMPPASSGTAAPSIQPTAAR